MELEAEKNFQGTGNSNGPVNKKERDVRGRTNASGDSEEKENTRLFLGVSPSH